MPPSMWGRYARMYITGYGSTLYIGMATVWFFSGIFRPPEITPNCSKMSPKKVQKLIYAGLLQTSIHTVFKTRKILSILWIYQDFVLLFPMWLSTAGQRLKLSYTFSLRGANLLPYVLPLYTISFSSFRA